jgi:hypothetical protein
VNGTLNIQTGANYTLSVSPAQNIQQGQSASYTISMAPAGTGFNGTVTLNIRSPDLTPVVFAGGEIGMILELFADWAALG